MDLQVSGDFVMVPTRLFDAMAKSHWGTSERVREFVDGPEPEPKPVDDLTDLDLEDLRGKMPTLIPMSREELSREDDDA